MRCTEHHFSASYEEAHRFDDAVVERGKRDGPLVPCVVTPRDLEVVHAVWRYKYLTTPQMLELWWRGRTAWAGQRRLVKLFRAGYLDRFRPLSRRGSFPWTYRIERDGLQLLKEAGVVERRERYEHRAIYDYVYVLHEVQCNAWVIAWRRLLGESFLGWWGESTIEPPQGMRAEPPLTLGITGTVEGLRDARPRLLRPDAVVETLRADGEGVRTFLIEYDRTGRPDKNLEKVRRYDAFLTWWWRYSAYQDTGPPFVIFVWQNEHERDRLLATSEYELTGYHCDSSGPTDEQAYVGRSRVLFAIDSDMHAGDVRAARVSGFPPEHRNGGAQAGLRQIRLPAPNAGRPGEANVGAKLSPNLEPSR